MPTLRIFTQSYVKVAVSMTI